VQLIGDLALHIPDVAGYERDARSKLSILDSEKREIKPTSKLGVSSFTRHRRLYQCLSGTDHTEGHQASKSRRRPWENVGCGFWARLTTTHLITENGEGVYVEYALTHIIRLKMIGRSASPQSMPTIR
jgi:hypothetical protein